MTRSGKIAIAYLSSYAGMGVARVACRGGCTCEPFELDAHRDARRSQQHVSIFVTHAALAKFHGRTCGIEVEVLNVTRSGGNKFKVQAVTVHWQRDDAGDAGAAARTEACRQLAVQEQLEHRLWDNMVKVPPWPCPNSAPVPPQGTPGGSGQLGTPRRARPS